MRTLRSSVAITAMLAVLAVPTAAVAEEDVTAEMAPIGGVVNGIMVQDYENPMGCAEWVMPDGTTMPAPTHLTSATGVTDLLGPTTVSLRACYSAADMFQNVSDGQWTMAGEGEDGLSGTYSANCIPDFSMDTGTPWECVAEFTVTGGTGAYDGASGRLTGIATFMGTGFSEEGLMRAVPSEMRFEGIVES